MQRPSAWVQFNQGKGETSLQKDAAHCTDVQLRENEEKLSKNLSSRYTSPLLEAKSYCIYQFECAGNVG